MGTPGELLLQQPMAKVTEESVGRAKPLCMIILDGFGLAPPSSQNAIHLAKTPNIDRLMREYPHTDLIASGEAVGLPPGQMGNSEVGHLNIGAGRVVYQELSRISRAIDSGVFSENKVLSGEMERVKSRGSALHLMGLVSDGGVHSHNTHLYALLRLARDHGVGEVKVHAFLDGRDVPPKSATGFLKELESKMAEIGVGAIASISGRYYAMDRDRRWERTKRAYDALVYGEGLHAGSALEALSRSYGRDEADEFVRPTIIDGAFSPVTREDSLIFFNLRSDRARQLTRAFIDPEFDRFDRGPSPAEPSFVCFTEYDSTFQAPVAFPPQVLSNVLADVVAQNGLRQLHTAETEKYAHVTFFFNGGVEEPKTGEERILVPSPKVSTYDLQPEMSAPEVAEVVCQAVRADVYDVIIVNLANADMVGHTGIMSAAVSAVEVIDSSVGRIVGCVREHLGECFILADHGNAERMVEEGDKPWTAHTENRVPFIYVTDNQVGLRARGRLADVAPTALQVLGLKKPAEMTGESLITENGK